MDLRLDASGLPRSRGVLFAEDFDLPVSRQSQDAEFIEPAFTQGDLQQARASGWQEGNDAARAEIEDALCKVAGEIAAQMQTARAELVRLAEESAETIAKLLLESLATALPALCASYGEGELRAVVRTVLPALSQEPAVTVRVNPGGMPALAQEIERLDPDLAERVQLVPTDAIPAGDVRITWRGGTATRNTADLWTEILEVLAPAGLLAPLATTKEMADAG